MKTIRARFPSVGLDGLPYGYEEKVSAVCCKGGGGDTTTVQKADPWEGQQPFLRDVFQAAQNQYRAGPIYASTQNPLAPLSDPTKRALEAYTQPGYATQGVQNAAMYGLGVVSDPTAAARYQSFAGGGGAGYGGGGASGNFVKSGVEHAKANTTNYSVPTANVDAATRLQAILNGADDPTFRAYMESANKNAADQIIRNKLLPQQVEQLMTGGYGGSSSQNIGRAAAVDIADTIGRNNNALILDHQGKQLEAANIVRGAQQDASAADIGAYNAGVAGASVQQRAAEAAAQQGTANREISLRAMMAGDDLTLRQAQLGGQLAPTYDALQYSQAGRDAMVGSIFDRRAQTEVDTSIAREMFNRNAPNVALQNYAGLVSGGGYGGTTTATGPGGGTSTLAGAAGGALAGVGAVGGATQAGLISAGAASGPVGWGIIGASALLGSGLI